jgi:hypothetical protein
LFSRSSSFFLLFSLPFVHRTLSFVKQLASLSSSSEKHNSSDYKAESLMEETDVGEEDFVQMASTLQPEEQVSMMRLMFSSLKQFKKLLNETNSLPADISTAETFKRLVNRVRTVVNAEHALLFLVRVVVFCSIICSVNSYFSLISLPLSLLAFSLSHRLKAMFSSAKLPP